MMMKRRNTVQAFIRTAIRLVVIVPLLLLLVYPDFRKITDMFLYGAQGDLVFRLLTAFFKTILIFWLANLLANTVYILPQWERLILLRLGKSVGSRGPGLFYIPPFIYEVANIIDVRISTYEVKATKTLTQDNIPVDVTAAVELEIEDPEKAVINVKDYWKTTEWASMEALKSTIGRNDLRPLLSETEKIAKSLKADIDSVAQDYGVNVRAVRITDVGTPPALVEELAVIARAERSSQAKKIQANAEIMVAKSLAEASEILSKNEGTMQLRQIQALLEMSKEESATIILYPMDGLKGSEIAASTASVHSKKK
jgi:regulator of protease activity HflC (stomatin/prohibitin superfamily)